MSQPEYGQVINALTAEWIRPASFIDLVDSLFSKDRVYMDWKLHIKVKVEGENTIAHEMACAILSKGS